MGTPRENKVPGMKSKNNTCPRNFLSDLKQVDITREILPKDFDLFKVVIRKITSLGKCVKDLINEQKVGDSIRNCGHKTVGIRLLITLCFVGSYSNKKARKTMIVFSGKA